MSINQEERDTLLEELEDQVAAFEEQMSELIHMGDSIRKNGKKIGGSLTRAVGSMDAYLIGRLKSFRDGREMFNIDELAEAIEEEKMNDPEEEE